MSSQNTDDVHWNPNNCLAVVGTTGKQCSSTSKDPLCGTHAQSRSVTRVDEFDAPNEDLRDELVEDCEMDGSTAFALSTVAEDIEDLWRLVTGLQDAQIGPDEWSGRKLSYRAEDVGKHPDLDVDDHPLAESNCAAFPASSTGSERCSSGGHGTSLMCSLHMDTADPETIYDDEHRDDDLEAIELAESVTLYEENHRLKTAELEPRTEFILVEVRGDDAIVVTPERVLERLPMGIFDESEEVPEEIGDWVRSYHSELSYGARAKFDLYPGVSVILCDTESKLNEYPDRSQRWIAYVDGPGPTDRIELYAGDDVEYGRKKVLEYVKTTTPETARRSIDTDETRPSKNSKDRPPLLARVSEGDDVRLRLEDNSFIRGTIEEVHVNPKQVAILVETEDERSIPVLSNEKDGGWGPCKAREEANVEDLGEVVGMLNLDKAVAVGRGLAGAKITLVGCGDDKLDEPAPARELYQSNYFGLKRQYAEERPGPWFILSALYGLVDPAEVVLPYDKSLDDDDVDDEYLKEWDLLVAEQCPDIGYAQVEILAGSTYVDAVEETFSMYVGSTGSFSAPTSGGLPQRMKWLSEHTGEETEDVQEGATFICSSCEDVVEDSPMPMHTCAFCGGEMVLEDDYDPVDEEAVERRRELLEDSGLTPKQAEVLAYKDETGLSHAEIGERMDIAKGTVDRHSARAQDAIADVDERIEDLQEEIERLERLKTIANNASIAEFAD